MRLTDFTDYSLRVLIYVAVCGDELATIQEISDALGIARGHLAKIVHTLGRNGYLRTTRGRMGGMRLGRAANEITVGSVVRDTEADFHIVECFNAADNRCAITAACNLRGILQRAAHAYMEVLDQCTLADIVIERGTLARLIAGPPTAQPLVQYTREQVTPES
ncbi:Rrf2 family transcriptional regulator [Paraburkholderia sp.]|uniref:Rrf2 family transcriptional regulator n=1 Tax=Paraburkholderia sp. TaxID=1926495 RepID=UPI0025E25019|nr:Rrf2 family transcriptional regulator [Paraburkholderia sp.]